LGDEELLRDVSVPISVQQVMKDLHFAIGKQLVREVFGQLGRDRRRNFPLSGMDLANDLDQFAGGDTLEQISVRAMCESSPNLVVLRKTSDDDETCIRKLGANRDHEFDAAYVLKPHIHENDISLVLTKIVDRLASCKSLGHQPHVGLTIDDSGDS